MFLGVYNQADSGTFSAGDWSNLSNVQSRDLFSVARSTDATTASTKFQIDLGSSKSIRCLSLHAHNLSSVATVTLKAGTSAGASDVLNSTGNDAYSVTFDDTRQFSSHYAVIIDASVSARYWTVEITDTTNAAGYVEIGRVGLWQGLEPTNNMEWGVEYGVEDIFSDTAFSLGGDFFYEARGVKRTVNFGLNVLLDTEALHAHEISRIVGRTGEVLFYSGDDQTYDVLGRLEKPNSIRRRMLDLNISEFKVVEL